MEDGSTNRQLVAGIFQRVEAQGDWSALMEALAEDVEWTVTGTSPNTGVYRSKNDCVEKLILPVQRVMQGPIQCKVHQIIVDESTAMVRWSGRAVTRSGIPYHQEFCWILEINSGKIVAVRAFFDTLLASLAILSTHPDHAAYSSST